MRRADAEALATLLNLPGFRSGTVRLPFTSPDDIRQGIEKASPARTSLERFSGRRAHAGSIGNGWWDAHCMARLVVERKYGQGFAPNPTRGRSSSGHLFWLVWIDPLSAGV